MSHYRSGFLAGLARVLTLLALCAPLFAAAEAELILKNGRIWTGDPSDRWAEAIAIRRHRIIAVGNNVDVAALAGSSARVIDLSGRLTVPGFNDAHVHFLNGAMRLLQADLSGACTVAEIQRRLHDFAAAHPRDAWVTGAGWDPACMANHQLLGRTDLDAAIRDRPAFITAADGHMGLANTRALQLAGIAKTTKYDGAGKIGVDSAGEPSGILREGAQTLVRRLIPGPGHERRLSALEQAVAMATSLGITSIQNAGGDDETMLLFEDLEREHKLNIRVAAALSISPTATPDTVDHLVELRQLYHDNRVRVTGVEFVLDGSVAAHTAALLEPYAGEPGALGRTNWSQDGLNQMFVLCDSGGLQLWTHASGDRAVRMALEGYDYVRRTSDTRENRFRIEHAQLIANADLAKFVRAGVMAVMTPAQADPSTLDQFAKALGPQRIGLAFPWHSLEQAGARLAFSSDWPSSASMDPIRGIAAAVGRAGPQRVSVETALAAWTSAGAYASFEDRLKGRLKPGMLADIVVLSQNLFNIDPRQIERTKVDMTIFDGQVIYTRQ
ncbi:MAG TPA: amidohydrolase [Bryobacteraceae bacterium]|nr:amidohydrolase [Bryobacteraceae bacterium]